MCMIFQENGNRGIAQKPSKQFYTLLYRSQRPDFMSNYSFFQNGCFSNFPKDSMRILCKKGQNYWKYRVCKLNWDSNGKRDNLVELHTLSLCSRNFQNVKLMLDFVKTWSIYGHWDFMWNPVLVNSNSPKMSILAILETQNFESLVHLGLESCSNLLKSKLRTSKIAKKWYFWTAWIRQNLISRKIWVAVKLSNANIVKP